MSGRAGYDLGQSMSEVMGRKYHTKLSQVLAKAGNILGMTALFVGVFLSVFVDDLLGIGLLIGFGGVIFFWLMHLIAWKHDKRKKPRTPSQDDLFL